LLISKIYFLSETLLQFLFNFYFRFLSQFDSYE
jgi:hypothetical protein